MTNDMRPTDLAMIDQADDGTMEISGLPVRADICFSDHKDRYKKRIDKRQRKLLAKIDFIQPFLWEGEEILLVTTGCSPMSLFEQWLTGWIIYYQKRCIFIFTTMRIFHVPTQTDYSYRDSISHILHGDCDKIKLRGRTLKIKYVSRKNEKFY